jgi:TetR/AcrR family transcriptional repressor of nem operon
MARPKEFDREVALRGAIEVFCDAGFEGASTDDLLRRMRISRQSLYDTFGDKRALYLEALRHYLGERVATQIRVLSAEASPLRGLEAAMNAFVTEGSQKKRSGCMGIGAICEFGRSDPEIAALIDAVDRPLMSAIRHRIEEGKSKGEIGAGVDAQAAAEFVIATFAGIKLAARSGASRQTLDNIARMSMRSLKY